MMRAAMSSRRRLLLALPAVTGVLLLASATNCTSKAAEGRDLLRRPAVTGIQAADDSLQNPFREVSPGVFMRTVFGAPYAPGLTVEIQDLEVRSKRATGQLLFPGAALLEVRSGRAMVTSGQQPKELHVGAILALPQGQALVLDNRADAPLSIRLYLVTAK